MPQTSPGTLQTGPRPSRRPHLATGLAAAATLGGGVCMGLWLAYPHRDFLVVPAAASAVAYLIAAIRHPAGRYLRNLHPVEDIVPYIRRMRSAPPIIRFNGERFHHELRKHWVIETCVEPDGRLHEREVPRDE